MGTDESEVWSKIAGEGTDEGEKLGGKCEADGSYVEHQFDQHAEEDKRWHFRNFSEFTQQQRDPEQLPGISQECINNYECNNNNNKITSRIPDKL